MNFSYTYMSQWLYTTHYTHTHTYISVRSMLESMEMIKHRHRQLGRATNHTDGRCTEPTVVKFVVSSQKWNFIKLARNEDGRKATIQWYRSTAFRMSSTFSAGLWTHMSCSTYIHLQHSRCMCIWSYVLRANILIRITEYHYTQYI